MKTSNDSSCSSFIFWGIIVLGISFIFSNFWIILLGIILIVIVVIIYFVSSNKEDVKQQQKITSNNIQSSNRLITISNASTKLNNDYTYHDHSEIKYSKVEAAPKNYIIFDLETTGLKYFTDEILEIGAIKYIDNIETERFHTYVKVIKTIPDYITAINHITASTIKDAPLIKSALIDFISFIENYTLIAFNSDFDMSFIQYNCKNKLHKTIDNDVIDALPLAKKYLSDLPNKKLETIKRHFGLTVGSHNAIDDCIVTNHLYQYCRQFEELKYRYIIPFAYDPQELLDIEVEYINTVVEICEKNGISRKDLTLSKNSKFLSVIQNSRTIIEFKLYGRLQYALLQIPFSDFESECNTEIKYTPSVKSEGDRTRIFTENAQQLWEFEKYIVKKRHQWTVT